MSSTIFGAAARDDADRIDWLMRGADPSAVASAVNARSDSGSTALHTASGHGSTRAVEALLRLGADPSLRDVESGSAPLHVALGTGSLGAALALMRAGARADDDDNSALKLRATRSLDSWAAPPLAVPPPAPSVSATNASPISNSNNNGENLAPRDKDSLTPGDISLFLCRPLVQAMAAERIAARRHLRENVSEAKGSCGSFDGLSGRARKRFSSTSSAQDVAASGSASGAGGLGVSRRARSGAGSIDSSDPSVFGRLAASGVSVEEGCEDGDPRGGGADFFEDLLHTDWTVVHAPRTPISIVPIDVPSVSGGFSSPMPLGAEPPDSNSGTIATIAVPSVHANASADAEWTWRTSLHSWGEDIRQLGFTANGGTNQPRALALQEAGSSDGSSRGSGLNAVISVTASAHHTLLLTRDGSVWAFGDGSGGRLGLGDSAAHAVTPKLVPFFAASRLRVISIAAGERHSLAITAGGALFSWGDGRNGSLGLGFLEGDAVFVKEPTRVDFRERGGGGGGASAGSIAHVISAAASASHSFAITGDGVAWAWGSNWSAQLGLRDAPFGGEKPDRCNVWAPRRTDILRDRGSAPMASGVACGDSYSLLITTDGDVWSVGRGSPEWSRLAFDIGSANLSDSVASYIDASAGISKSKSAAASAPLQSRLKGIRARAPAAPTTPRPSSVPTALEAVSALAARGFVTGRQSRLLGTRVCASGNSSDEDSAPSSWSHVGGGGRSSARTPSSPLASGPIVPASIKAVSAGRAHALALDDTGGVWAWGAPGTADLQGVSGDSPDGGSNGASWSVPRRVHSLSRAGVVAVRIAATVTHSAVVDNEGRLYVWGSAAAAERGLLAAGRSGAIGLPRRVASLAQVLDVSVGARHTIAVCGSYEPPLPPLRPSSEDVARVMLLNSGRLGGGSEQPGWSDRAGAPPRGLIGLRVELWDAARVPENSRRDASWARARARHDIYAPVVADEVRTGRDIFELWRSHGSEDDGGGDDSRGDSNWIGASGVTTVVPSLRSICERSLLKSGAGVGVGNAISLLCLGSTLNSPALSAYAGAFLNANTAAVLAFASTSRGRDMLQSPAFIDASAGLCFGRWSPSRGISDRRATDHETRRARVRLFKALKRREAGLVRPASKWGVDVPGDVRWRRVGMGGVVTAAAASRLPVSTGVELPASLDSIAVEDAIRARSLLFAGTHGPSMEAVNVENASIVEAAAAAAELSSAEAGAAAAAASSGSHSNDDDNSQSFQAAFRLITNTRVRDFGDASDAGAAPSRSSSSINSPNAAALLDENGQSAAADSDNSDGESPSYAASPSRTLSSRANQTGSSKGGVSIPEHLRTTLPSCTTAAVQASLDRLACNLAELRAGAGQEGRAVTAALRRAAPMPLLSARRVVNDSMLDDASGLAKRIRTLRKKLGEATQLAISAVRAVCTHDKRGGGGERRQRRGASGGAAASRHYIGEAQKVEKVSRRLEWVREAFTIGAHAMAVQELLNAVADSVNRAPPESAAGADASNAAAATLLRANAASGAAYLTRLDEVRAEIESACALLGQLSSCGLTAEALAAAGVTPAAPTADVDTSVAAVIAAGSSAEEAEAAVWSAIVGARLSSLDERARADVARARSLETSSPITLDDSALSPLLPRASPIDFGDAALDFQRPIPSNSNMPKIPLSPADTVPIATSFSPPIQVPPASPWKPLLRPTAQPLSILVPSGGSTSAQPPASIPTATSTASTARSTPARPVARSAAPASPSYTLAGGVGAGPLGGSPLPPSAAATSLRDILCAEENAAKVREANAQRTASAAAAAAAAASRAGSGAIPKGFCKSTTPVPPLPSLASIQRSEVEAAARVAQLRKGHTHTTTHDSSVNAWGLVGNARVWVNDAKTKQAR
jgi:alpha-tubulin suppressor-like RCC1 family protein